MLSHVPQQLAAHNRMSGVFARLLKRLSILHDNP